MTRYQIYFRLEPHLNMAHIRGMKKSYPGWLNICNSIRSGLEFSKEIHKCSLNALTKIKNIPLLSATKINSFNLKLNQWAVSQTTYRRNKLCIRCCTIFNTACFLVLWYAILCATWRLGALSTSVSKLFSALGCEDLFLVFT